MKLIFLTVAAIVLCNVLMSAEAAKPRPRIIRIRIIRIIPIRRGRRDVSEQTTVLPSNGNHRLGSFVSGNDPDTLIYKLNAENGEVTQEEIARLCDSVRQQVKQTTGEDVGFEVEVQPAGEQ